MTTELKTLLGCGAILITTFVVIMKIGENNLNQQIVSQCQAKFWPEENDAENKAFCKRYFRENGLNIKY
jgi:siroheme synthase (precorrin-2 oxidase/ferrochelatase)